jgi:hypothetical protein
MTVSELARNAGFPGDRVRQAGLSRVRLSDFKGLRRHFRVSWNPTPTNAPSRRASTAKVKWPRRGHASRAVGRA